MPMEEEIKRGEGLMEAGQADQALQAFEAVLQQDPNNLSALNDAGVVYFHLKRFDEAERTFRRVLAIEPLDNAAAVNLYNALVALRAFEQALEVLTNYQQAFTPDDLDRMQRQVQGFRFEKQPEQGRCMRVAGGRPEPRSGR